MTPKTTDPKSSEPVPAATAERVSSMSRYVFIDAATGEVFMPTEAFSSGVLGTIRLWPAPNATRGFDSMVEDRKMTRAEKVRAFLKADRVSKRGGAKGGAKRSRGASFGAGEHLVRVPSTLVAQLVEQGYFEPRPSHAARLESDKPIALATATQAPGETVHESSLSDSATWAAPGNRSAVSDFEAEADRLSLPLGTAPSDEEALRRLRIVAADANDIFPNTEAAIDFLTARPLDGRGRNGIEILRQKGLPGILSSLDQRRFGYSG